MKIEFKIVAHASDDWRRAVKIREEILRKPLGTSFTTEELAEEKNQIQVIGCVNNEIIATAVLVAENADMKMQRVVVVAHLRNLDIGSKMMVFCESYAEKNGFTSVYCHARNSAVNFYLNNRYVVEGDFFDEDEIPHLKMRKRIVNKN